MLDHQVVVIGAGPSGVAVALSLRDRGLRPLLIDRADHVGSSWAARYDRLRLNTGRLTSHMPNRRYRKGTGLFPTRDEVVDHLDHHAHEDGIELLLGTLVRRIDRSPRGWQLVTSAGDIAAQQVVVATGYEHTPHLPEWPGMNEFAGELMHSSAYRNPARFAGKKVLVVGAGSSAMEIVYDVASGGAACAWLAVRTTPHIMVRSLPGGFPSDYIANPMFDAPVWFADRLARIAQRIDVGDLSAYGLPTPEEGVFARGKRQGRAPVIVDREVIRAIRDRVFEVVPTISGFSRKSVELIDGRILEPDAVICATGYTRGLEPLVGHLGILTEHGLPVATGLTPAAPGLRFVGFLSRPGLISFVAKQSERLAADIENELGERASLSV